eukprot:TRINITY_DN20580_c0_g2_i2.p1 TRINITY_DN20580_c0_g2~~TRINITY_DN20580_c0_g2_i2.p1  ORF type:complete len:806 (-),score=35.67 TRINITY_DN20580_c0_g2_i2:42-2246(-)
MLRGTVVRVRKLSKASNKLKYLQQCQEIEDQVWLNDELSSFQGTEEQAYIVKVLIKLFGSRWIKLPVQVQLCDQWQEHLRRKYSQVQNSLPALLMPDLTRFISEAVPYELVGPCLAVELKPKCGFIPVCDNIHPDNSIKRELSRYKLHQYYKQKQGKIMRLSQYDPIQIFSGKVDQIENALEELIDNPQNNFKLFIDGQHVYGDRASKGSHTCTRMFEAYLPSFGYKIQEVSDDSDAATYNNTYKPRKTIKQPILSKHQSIGANDCVKTEWLIKLLAQVLVHEKILDSILKVQKLDEYDIEGTYTAFMSLLQSSQREAEVIDKCIDGNDIQRAGNNNYRGQQQEKVSHNLGDTNKQLNVQNKQQDSCKDLGEQVQHYVSSLRYQQTDKQQNQIFNTYSCQNRIQQQESQLNGEQSCCWQYKQENQRTIKTKQTNSFSSQQSAQSQQLLEQTQQKRQLQYQNGDIINQSQNSDLNVSLVKCKTSSLLQSQLGCQHGDICSNVNDANIIQRTKRSELQLQTANQTNIDQIGSGSQYQQKSDNSSFIVLDQVSQQDTCQQILDDSISSDNADQVNRLKQNLSIDLDTCINNSTATQRNTRQQEQIDSSIASERYRVAYQTILDMTQAEKLQLIRNYLTSATAKDMAIVIAIQQCSSDGFLGNNLYESSARFQCMVNNSGQGYHGMIWDEMYDVCFLYKVSLLDLDKKSVAKIFTHKDMDQRIVNCAMNYLDQYNQSK